MRTFKLLFVVVSLVLMSSAPLFAKTDVQAVQEAIRTQNAQWHAGENWVTQLSWEEQRRLCGARLDIPADTPTINIPIAADLPDNFDWRNNGGCGTNIDFSNLLGPRGYCRL